MKKSLLIFVLVAAAACGREHPFGFGKKPEPPKPAGPSIGEYKAKWLDGSTFDLAKERGNVVFLNVWATWCGPCRFEIPELDKLHAKYAGRGFKVVGVSVDEGGIADVKAFVEQQKIGYPIAVDPEGKLATMLNTSVIPTSVLVDRNGNIVWKHFGIVSMTDASLNHALEAALAR